MFYPFVYGREFALFLIPGYSEESSNGDGRASPCGGELRHVLAYAHVCSITTVSYGRSIFYF